MTASLAQDVFAEADALTNLDGDRELLRALLRLFVELSPLLLGDVSLAQSRGDAEKLVRLAHRLAASAGQICAYRVATAAREVAAVAGQDGAAACSPAIGRLASELGQLLARLGNVD
ncbi:MAG TPA: Hpt domain-containing protein [Terriglobales bacterium]|nr:Hpt domain-containing protein [Terriglobales bacterium]